MLSRLPTHLLKRDHSIIFCKNEQCWVLQVVNFFSVSDDAWEELREMIPEFHVVLQSKACVVSEGEGGGYMHMFTCVSICVEALHPCLSLLQGLIEPRAQRFKFNLLSQIFILCTLFNRNQEWTWYYRLLGQQSEELPLDRCTSGHNFQITALEVYTGLTCSGFNELDSY